MSRPRVEWHIVRITRDHPALAEIMNKMEDIGVFALKDDPLTVPTVAAHYTERPDLYHKFVRMQLEVGLIGGQLYGAFSGSEVTPDSLVGLALWYEPDTEFMASDAEHGPWDAYMRDIQPETKQWWDDISQPTSQRIFRRRQKRYDVSASTTCCSPRFSSPRYRRGIVQTRLEKGGCSGSIILS